MNQTPDKWMKLMLYLQNATPAIHHCIFSSIGAGHNAADRMRAVIKQNPTWFHMTILQRGCDVWAIKDMYTQKVVINDE